MVLLCCIGSVIGWTQPSETFRPAIEKEVQSRGGHGLVLLEESIEVHLLSLQWSDSNPQVRQIWKWKDTVLGDGRDFFVPKPKTLSALNRLLVESVGSEECAVLSNCARLEILLVAEKDCQNQESTIITQAVSQCLLAQVESHAASSNSFLSTMMHSFDWPNAIDTQARLTPKDSTLQWTHLSGVESVCRHLCVVASGMAERPSRPGRPVPFRPFSSRDAHILLQLKRTSEVRTCMVV